MRMSIFDVVERIGGARAQGILARQLEITARGAEIVHLDGNLERLAGDTYVGDVLAAARGGLDRLRPVRLLGPAGVRRGLRPPGLWRLLLRCLLSGSRQPQHSAQPGRPPVSRTRRKPLAAIR